MSTAPSAASPVSKALPPQLAKAMSRLTEISSLPEITTRVVAVVEDPRATAADMHDIVKNDPALATKILKVVNSAFYGLPSQIASLDRAIIMLGLSAVKNVALAASLAQLFRGEPITEQFTPQDLWRHCISVGVCARRLAQKSGVAQADEYFVSGLVHDMGLLVVAQLFPERLREVTERCYETPQDFCAAEREILGADHQMFGAALAEKWRFPPVLRNAASYHHDPENLKPEFRKLTTCVFVADTICARLQHGYYLTSQVQEVTADQLALIGFNPAGMGELCEELPELIEEAEAILIEHG